MTHEYTAILENYSSVVWYQIFITLMFMLLSLCIDEYLLRRNLGYALIFVLFSILIIILNCVFGIYSNTFVIIKAFSLFIPLAIAICFRLANSGGNIINNQDDNVTINSIRYVQYKKYTKIYPKWFIKFLNKLTSKKILKYFYYFCYIILAINIFEAVIFESFMTQNYGNYTWSKYLNSICGILLIITQPPPPYYKYKYKQSFWYIDTNTNSKYSDFILYFPNNKKFNYIGFIWIVLYTTWNFEYCIRYYGADTLSNIAIHLINPFIRSLCCNRTTLRFDFHLWFQSRGNNLWLDILWVIPLKELIFSVSRVEIKQLEYSITLTIWSIFNLFLGVIYFFIWYFWYLPQVKNDENDDIINKENNNKNEMKLLI